MKTSNLRRKLGVIKYGNIIDFLDDEILKNREITDEWCNIDLKRRIKIYNKVTQRKTQSINYQPYTQDTRM